MSLSHVDRVPLGDIATTIAVTAATNPEVKFTVTSRGDQFYAPAAAGLARRGSRKARFAAPRRALSRDTDQGTNRQGSREYDRRRARRKSSCQGGCEEASEEELLARLDEVLERYKDKPGALIPVLQLAQGICGYLPEFALKHIAKGLKQALQRGGRGGGLLLVLLHRARGARNLIRVCLGTACYVRGGMAVLESLKKELGIDVGETTEDREFSLEVARCFGACGLAPVITVNDVVHHRVKPARINEILAQYGSERRGAPVAAGVGERSS